MFDPYRKWLGIPEGQGPPTYYQLLGISRGESDLEVIHAAALRQIGYVRNFQAGPQAVECARLLGELARARAALSDSMLRVAYDATLPPPEATTTPPASLDPAPEARPAASRGLSVAVDEGHFAIKAGPRRAPIGVTLGVAAVVIAAACGLAYGLRAASKTSMTPRLAEATAPPAPKPTPAPAPKPAPARTSAPPAIVCWPATATVAAPREGPKPAPVDLVMRDAPPPRRNPQAAEVYPAAAIQPPKVEARTPPAATDEEPESDGPDEADGARDMPSTDVPALADDEEGRAEKALNAKGLHRDKGRFVLREEDAVLATMGVVKAAGDALKLAQGRCNAINAVDWNLQATVAQIQYLSREMEGYRLQMRSIPVRRAAMQAAFFEESRRNWINSRDMRDQLASDAETLRRQQAGPDQRRAAWALYEQARGAFLAKIGETRPLIEPVAEQYRQLARDPEVKAALDRARPDNKTPPKLGPSRQFLDMVKYVNGAKAATDLAKKKAAPKSRSGRAARK